jgi:hypothetical protein
VAPKQLRDDNGPRTHRLRLDARLNQQNAENRNLHLHAASVRTDRIYYLQFFLKKEEDVVESFTRFQATLGMAIGMIPRMEARRVLRRRWRFQDPGKMNPPISHSRYESWFITADTAMIGRRRSAYST